MKSHGSSLALPPPNVFKRAATMCTSLADQDQGRLLSVPWRKKLCEGLAEISQMLPPADHSFAEQNIFSDKADFGPSQSSVSAIALSSSHGVGLGGQQEQGAEGEG